MSILGGDGCSRRGVLRYWSCSGRANFWSGQEVGPEAVRCLVNR